MIKIFGVQKYLLRDADGKEHIVGQIIVGDVSDLVGLTELDGAVFEDGTLAWAIKEGEIYGYCDGSWFRQSDGSEVTDLSAAKLTSQSLTTTESEVTADDLTVGRTESE